VTLQVTQFPTRLLDAAQALTGRTVDPLFVLRLNGCADVSSLPLVLGLDTRRECVRSRSMAISYALILNSST
jgi:hypothetical protein